MTERIALVGLNDVENAALQEGMVKIVFAISEGMGPFVYRMAPLEQL